MAISGLAFACRPHYSLRPSLFHCIRKVRFSSVAAIETIDEPEGHIKNVSEGDRKEPEWKKLNSKDLGISTSMITRPTKKVLNGLKKKGFEVYLVGGCVRDLILKRTPKDFDILTSAELKEVVRTFSRCEIVGKRFPICHVHIEGTLVEVSSFSTCGRKFSRDLSYESGRPIGCDEKDYIRWRNCLQRDFTINGLMFDPYAKIVYDYMGGMEDIRKAKVRTVVPANTSFQEDCARILRAIRIAARLGFRFSRETAHFVKNLSCSVLRLDKGRLLMEMNYMLAYGSAEASMRLLWKFGLLEILLPIQAAYFVHHGFRRRDKRSNMLLSLFSNLDKLLAPDRPCHSSLWGLNYLHGGEPQDLLSDKNNSSYVRIKTSSKRRMKLISKWKPNENGEIPCPPTKLGGCGHKYLELKCKFQGSWVSELRMKVKGLVKTHKFKDVSKTFGQCCSCFKSNGENDISSKKLRKTASRQDSYFMQSLFSKLDKLLAPDRPCHSSLWVGILAFHKALCDQPRDPLVVAAYSLAVHNGGDMLEAVNIARRIKKPHDDSFHELLEPQNLDSQTLTDEVMDLAASVKDALGKMTDEYFVSQAMVGYPQAPFSDLVFIPLALYLRVCRIFECVRGGAEKGFVLKQGSKIDYESLALGSLREVRHTFARIVFDTVYPLHLT